MPYVGGLDVCRTLRSKNDRLADSGAHRARRGRRSGGWSRRGCRRLPDEAVRARRAAGPAARVAAAYRRPRRATRPRCWSTTTSCSTRRHTPLAAATGPIDLTRTEFALLELLLRNAGRPLPRETIMDRVWGWESEPTSNSLEVFVGYLRRKTEAAGEPRLIHTVRGVGYVLRARRDRSVARRAPSSAGPSTGAGKTRRSAPGSPPRRPSRRPSRSSRSSLSLTSPCVTSCSATSTASCALRPTASTRFGWIRSRRSHRFSTIRVKAPGTCRSSMSLAATHHRAGRAEAAGLAARRKIASHGR